MIGRYNKLIHFSIFGALAAVMSVSAGDTAAADWKPTEELQIITHVKTTSSTYLFAQAFASASWFSAWDEKQIWR